MPAWFNSGFWKAKTNPCVVIIGHVVRQNDNLDLPKISDDVAPRFVASR